MIEPILSNCIDIFEIRLSIQAFLPPQSASTTDNQNELESFITWKILYWSNSDLSLYEIYARQKFHHMNTDYKQQLVCLLLKMPIV